MFVAVSEAKLNGMGGNDHNCLIKLASSEQLDANLLPVIPTQVKPRPFQLDG